MKKIISLALALALAIVLCVSLFGCAGENKVVIYSSAEEYRNTYMLEKLKEKFPDYDISITYSKSGDLPAKILAEGEDTEIDIAFDLEYGKVEKINALLASVSGYDLSVFADDMVETTLNILPEFRNGGAIVVNKDALASKGLETPKTYQDLLKDEYKGLITMASPKASGTGYMFLKSLVNSMGEDEAFEYLGKLEKNIEKFGASGADPINYIVSKEAAIALGMTAQAVQEINNGVNLEIIFPTEGSPFSRYGTGIVKGHETRECVKKVFDYFYSDLILGELKQFSPEKVFKTQDFEIQNFPKDIKYADMENNTAAEKERLTEKWDFD